MNKQIEQVEGLNIVCTALILRLGKNILSFNPEFVATPESERPVFSLRQIIDPNYLFKLQIRTEKIPPVLSNLLPEGIL
ncbi:hypothetical protein ACPSKX_12715 [Moritella viscosa]